jgi:hypothetical protein
MPSKSRRSSNKRRDNLGLGTPHNKNQERVAPTHRTKDREKMDCLRTKSLGHKKRKTLERQKRILGSGVTSIRAPSIKISISTQRGSQWLRSKPLSQMWVLNLSQNQKGGDKSLMKNPLLPLLPPSSILVNQMSERKESAVFIHKCG